MPGQLLYLVAKVKQRAGLTKIEDEFGLERDEVRAKLRAAGVDTRPFFYPVHALPMYNTGQKLPVAEDLGRRGINLPSGATLSPEQIDYVCDTLASLAP